MATMPFFAHMGLIYVPLGNKAKYEGAAAHGGSAWVNKNYNNIFIDNFSAKSYKKVP